MKRISLGLVERKTLLSFPRTHFDNHCSPWFLSSHVLQSKWNPYVSDSLTLNSSKCSCRSFLKFEQFLNHTSSLWLYLAIIILNYLKNFTNLCGLIHIIMLSFGNKQTVQIFSQINPYYSFLHTPVLLRALDQVAAHFACFLSARCHFLSTLIVIITPPFLYDFFSHSVFGMPMDRTLLHCRDHCCPRPIAFQHLAQLLACSTS